MPRLDDTRNIDSGFRIPGENYCDQPYVVVNSDGSWTCVMTTGPGGEGAPGQHVVASISPDRGRSWSPLIDIEPATAPESSWVVPLRTPSGRIYAFYNYNKTNVREVPSIPQARPFGLWRRVDTLGTYACKYSDDGGRTWSRDRYEIPMRLFEIDRANPFHGAVPIFWGVGKPLIHEGAVYIFASKVGVFGPEWVTCSEGMLLRSDNLLSEHDPAKHRWTTLPDGDIGLRSPAGEIGEEHNGVVLSDGAFLCVYRTTQGYIAYACSRDRGHTWTRPAPLADRPGGRNLKHPRAAPVIRRFSNGRYLLWFHNHGAQGNPYFGRNPAWLCGGIEKDGAIHWSQPEIALYADGVDTRMSYPDFIETQGRYFVTETQKTIARVHELDAGLLEGLWTQTALKSVARNGLVLDLAADACRPGAGVAMPALPSLIDLGGFTLDLRFGLDDLQPGQILFSSRDSQHQGISIMTSERGTLQIALMGQASGGTDGVNGLVESSWDCDPHLLQAGRRQQATFVVDGGPKIILVLIDGVLCDGGASRPYGWGRFHPALKDANGAAQARLAPSMRGALYGLRLYDRALRVSEAVGNYQAAM